MEAFDPREPETVLNARAVATGGSVVLVATVLTSALGVGYTIGMARFLEPPAYANLIAILSLLGVLGLPAGPLQTVIAARAARTIGSGGGASVESFRRLTQLLALTAVGAVVVALLSIPVVAAFLQIDDWLALGIASPLLGLALLHPLVRGLAQGQARFHLLSVASVIDIGAKVIGGIAMVLAGFGVAGAIGMMVAGGATTLAFVGFAVRRRSGGALRNSPNPNVRTQIEPDTRSLRQAGAHAWADVVATFVGLGGLTSLVTLDAVLVKHAFTADEASAFAVLSVASRSLFWATGAITTVLLPVVARASGAGDHGRRSLWIGMCAAGFIAGIGELIFAIAPELVVRLLFGDRYATIAPLLPLIGLGSYALALASVVLTFLIAQGNRRGAAILPIAAVLQAVVLLTTTASLGDTVERLVWLDVCAFIALLLVALTGAYAPDTPRRAASVV